MIRLFEKANLLSTEQSEEFKDFKNVNPKGVSKSQKTKSVKKTTDVKKLNILQDSRGNLSLISGIEIQLSSSKNVEFGIMQLKDLLEEFKKDENIDDESNENVDTESDLEMKDDNVDDESSSDVLSPET